MAGTPTFAFSRRPAALSWLAALTILLAAAGCGDDNPPNVEPNQPDAANNDPSNNPNNNNANNGDGDAGSDADTATPAPLCDILDDGFALTQGEATRLQLGEAEEPNIASCGDFYDEADLSGAYVFEFAVENPVRLSWTIDPVARPGNEFELPPQPLVELRRGDECGRPERVTYCGDARENTYDLIADTRYFMVINGELDSTFELTLEWQELACIQGPDTCADGVISHCVSELAVETYACVADCLDESTCEADSCENAVAVDPAGGMTLAGHRSAYGDSGWSPDGLPNCSASVPGEAGVGSDGVDPDFFVELTNLSAGQLVTVDASASSGNYTFFILEGCDATACLHAGSLDGAFENTTTWTVPEGTTDAVLVVKAPNDSPRDFSIGISAQ